MMLSMLISKGYTIRLLIEFSKLKLGVNNCTGLPSFVSSIISFISQITQELTINIHNYIIPCILFLV